MNAPFVSVIIPTYNRGPLIAQAITSVLAQTCRDMELVVIDDGSTDNTREIVETYARQASIPVRYFYQENRGVPAARNSGLEVAGGELIAFLDSDDFWLPNHLEVCSGVLEDDKNCGAVFTDHAITTDGKTFIPTTAAAGKTSEELYARLVTHELVVHTDALLMRRAVFQALGEFIPDLPGAEDWEMWTRIGSRYPIRYIPQLTVIVRQHAQNMSADPDLFERNLPRAIEAILNHGGPDLSLLKPKMVARCHLDLSYLYALSGNRSKAVRHLAQAVRADWHFLGHALFRTTAACLLLGASGLQWLRTFKHRGIQKPVSGLNAPLTMESR